MQVCVHVYMCVKERKRVFMCEQSELIFGLNLVIFEKLGWVSFSEEALKVKHVGSG